MATKIIHKRSSVSSNVPAAGVLEVGEIAINLADKKIYTKNSSNEVIELGGASAIYTLDNITDNGSTTTNDIEVGELTATEVISDLRGSVIFKAEAGEAITKGQAVYISGLSGNTPIVSLANSSNSSKMPSFGIASNTSASGTPVDVVLFGTISGLDTSTYSLGDVLYVGSADGALTSSAPTGESSSIQNVGKVQRVHASAGVIKVGGAGRFNATPNLNEGNIFIGNASNQASTASLGSSITSLSNINVDSVTVNSRVISNQSDIYNSGTGRVFTITGGSDGDATYLSFTAVNHNGMLKRYYYCTNTSGNWTITEMLDDSIHLETPSTGAPTVTVANSGTSSATVTIVGAGSNPSSFGGGMLQYEYHSSYVSLA